MNTSNDHFFQTLAWPLLLTFFTLMNSAAANPLPFVPFAVRQVDIYPLDQYDSKLRVIEMNTAVSSALGEFDHYPIFVFELIKVPEQRLLKQVRIQTAITLDDGKKMVFKGTMDVIPRRHEFKDGELTVWVEYFPARPPGQLVKCSYKVSTSEIAKQSCTAEEFIFLNDH